MVWTCVSSTVVWMYINYFFYSYGDHRDLHGLTHSFPTRRSSDLRPDPDQPGWLVRPASSDGGFLDVYGELRVRAETQRRARMTVRSEEHTSELQSLMRISYAVFCLQKKKININHTSQHIHMPHPLHDLYSNYTYNTNVSHH